MTAIISPKVCRAFTILIDMDYIDTSDVNTTNPKLFLYQSGYLTIKNVIEDSYVLGFPNCEVKKALFELVIPIMLKKDKDETENAIQELKMNFSTGNVEEGILCLKQLIAHTPYSTQKKERFVFEEHFRFILKNLFYICGTSAATQQIITRHYKDAYCASHKLVVGLALVFDKDNRGLKDWNKVKKKGAPKLSVMSLGAPFYYVYAFRLVADSVLLSCGIRVRSGRHRW